LVYCTKCGTENDEDAVECKNCGAPMNQPTRTNRYGRNDWDFEDDCFGGRGRSTWPMLIGLFLVILGASQLLDDMFWWASFDTLWPLFIIAIGILVVTNAMRK